MVLYSINLLAICIQMSQVFSAVDKFAKLFYRKCSIRGAERSIIYFKSFTNHKSYNYQGRSQD